MKKHNTPTSIVIFGGTGDLAETKLLPALLDLFIADLLPDHFSVIALSRKEMSDEDYRSFFRASIERKGHMHSEELVDNFCSRLRYVQGDFTSERAYTDVIEELRLADAENGQCSNKLFYLAVPPMFYGEIFDLLHSTNTMKICDEEGSWSRLLVEKPFGSNLDTAKSLEAKLCSLFNEEQIYRIDHYLAKDAIENILALRFSNTLLADAWHNGEISSIDIKLLESKDVANRGSFYDGLGALRDVGQNHILQILALLAMDEVDMSDVDAVRSARASVISALDLNKTKINIAQYDGYTESVGVEPDSNTETYFSLVTQLDSEKWRGVDINFESGKAMPESHSSVEVRFKQTGFTHKDCSQRDCQNVLKIVFSPEPKISLTMWVKKPGFAFALESRELVLAELDATDSYSPEAYERVLYDCILGDQTRFVSGAEVVASWQFITPLLESFSKLELHKYQKGVKPVVE